VSVPQTFQLPTSRANVLFQDGGLRGTQAASEELLQAVAAKGRTINYALPGSDELRYLDYMRANANVGGENATHILLRTDPKKIEVLEEFLHGTQQRLGIIDRLGVPGAEVHVKEFMLNHQGLLGITAEDAAILEQMLGR
jgi:large repetitive protein